MNPYILIDKYYSDTPLLRKILVEHSEAVAEKALRCLDRHPELKADRNFVFEAAMLHDIGIFLTHAPSIECSGKLPYIAHGPAGALLLETEGLPLHARVAARHTGSGLSRDEILSRPLPLPAADLLPESVEEKVVCYADKFFSKGSAAENQHPVEKNLEEVRRQMAAYGAGSLRRFESLHGMFC